MSRLRSVNCEERSITSESITTKYAKVFYLGADGIRTSSGGVVALHSKTFLSFLSARYMYSNHEAFYIGVYIVASDWISKQEAHKGSPQVSTV